ncbi:unnamed protein product [Mytilus coruscus]|uniref:Reverse transcriptase domain-containing protein n=1 Tax=Mytilus coruscus TaxID=42192 RepID=A0A6J7ZYW0_MYTCO|nr:unnamed protein product [Mytilus coruscus]
MIQHLSYTLESSINSFIDPKLATVQYTSFDKVLGTISKLGKGAEMTRMVIVSAFRLIILHPDELVLFGFRFQDNFYFQKALPMGCSAACALFEKFSCFLEWLVRFQSLKESKEHYLDDFLLAGEARSGECLHLMNNFRTICSDIGVPLEEEKTLGPSCIMTFLGLEIDTLEMVIRIPQDKLTEVKGKLELTVKKRKIILRDLQSLVGSLNFFAKVNPSVRAFNRRFCDAMCGIQRPNHFIRVTLENFNGTLAFGESEWLSNSKIHLFTAGSPDLGCGVYFSGRWAYFQWPSSLESTDVMADITFLELVPIVLSILLFKEDLHNKRILFHTDNKALVSILNKKSSKSRRVMELIRPFVLHTMLFNMQFKAVHIEGRSNVFADAISRKHWHRFRMVASQVESEATPIPETFLQLISDLKFIA